MFPIIFVPPPFAADAIMEAADAGISYCLHYRRNSVKDMIVAYEYIKGKNVNLIGPNCPVLSP